MAVSTIDPNGLNIGQIGGTRNLIINGAMQVAQRGTSASGLTNGSDPYQTVDRFRFVEQGSPTYVVTMSQSSTAPVGFASSLKIDITTAQASLAADENLAVDTILEAQNLQPLGYGSSSANTATLSFWVRSNKTGTYVVYFYQYDDDRSTTHSYTVNSADTWEYKTITVPADTVGVIDNNNDRGIVVRWPLASGTNYTSGTASTTWASDVTANRYNGLNVNLADNTANEWYLTGVQLEVGDTATPFEHRSYGQELALCQRYFCKIQNNMGGTRYLGMLQAFTSSATFGVIADYPQVMRTVPSVAQGGSFGFFKSDSGNASATTTIGGFQPGNQSWLSGGWGGSSVLTAGHACVSNAPSTSTITADAEL